MGLKNLGEFGLISEIKRKFQDMTPSNIEGIGDDCAVIPKDDKSSYVVTTDMLVEGRHFLMDKISPFELGYKSLAVNLSDVASMGATPKFSFLSFALTPSIEEEWCKQYIEGFHNLSLEFGVPLLGGDTTSTVSGSATISVTVIGEVLNENIKYRKSAKTGDIIAVTSVLGDSAVALKLMLSEICPSDYLKGRHNMPHPHVKEGEWLGTQFGVNAMMDISDGVASDITHICKLSDKGANIYMGQIPHSAELVAECKSRGFDILDISLSGGEDYSLLLTIDKAEFDTIKKGLKENCGTDLYAIGEITADSRNVRYIDDKGNDVLQKLGFRHF